MALLGVIIGQYAIQRRQERQADRELETLIDSLIVELRTADHWIERLLYLTHDPDKAKESAYSLTEEQRELFESDQQLRLCAYLFTPSRHRPSTNVYRSNGDKIGKLDSEAAEAVIEAYSSISVLKSSLQNLQDATSFGELASEDDIDWSSGAGLSPEVIMLETQIESAVTTAATAQKQALLELGGALTDSDKAVFLFAFNHVTAQSETTERLQEILEENLEKHDLSYEELVELDNNGDDSDNINLKNE